jgi:quinol monooxygenase YgiN
MSELQVIARYTILAGREADVIAKLSTLQAAVRTEPGNLAFDVYREVDDDRSVVLLERYTSKAAFAEHRETPHFTEIVLGQIVPLLERRVVETYDVATD